jgi:DNA-binding XRE family transcriptional regulator
MAKKKYPKNWIRELRKQRHVTSTALGERVGVSGQHITMLEKGERGLSIDLARKIAAALDCHHLDVIDGPGELMLPRGDREKKLLENFRAMQDKDQENYLSMGDIFAAGGPASETTNTETKKEKS